MSWTEHHRVSERLASEAQAALRSGDSEQARVLYARAADAEHDAVASLDGAKIRTLAISWVSMASLYYKAGMVEHAEQVAWLGLDHYSFPDFAKRQLRNLLQSIVLGTFTSKHIALDSNIHMHESILPRIVPPAPAAEENCRVRGSTRGIATIA